MNVTIREADAGDLPAVLALYAQPDLDNGQVLSLEQAERVFAEFSRFPSYRLFVAVDGPAIVGTYALLIMPNLAHRGTPSAVAEDVVVLRARQGQGIGRQMMAHAKACARAAGCYKLALSSNLRRQAAHGFYQSVGFVQHGISFVIEP